MKHLNMNTSKVSLFIDVLSDIVICHYEVSI